MSRQNIIRIFAGGLVTIASLMAYFVNINWIFLSLFVGLNLFQYGFSNFCPLNTILKKLGIKE